MTKLVVVISGRGSNMCAIVDACANGTLAADVVAVISNNPDAEGLAYARARNIPTAVVDSKAIPDRNEFDAALREAIDSFRPDWIALAGFMRILGADTVNAYLGRLINIHPSLLPKYPGLNTHARVLAAGDSVHGASVHFVTPELDAGPVIEQSEVPVKPDDTESTLAERVLRTEHALYVRALQLCVSGNCRFINGECYLGKQSNLKDTASNASDGHQHS